MKFSRRITKPIYRTFFFIIIVGLIISFLNFYQKEVKNFFYKISEPIQRVLWDAGDKISDFFEAVAGIQNFKRENEELKLRIQELLAQLVSLKELEKENEQLREALNIGLGKEFNLALAQVIGKDISQDFILINKGAEDGISEGLPVISHQKVLVGKISEVYKNFSQITLISNKSISFDGKIVGKEILGQVLGRGDLKIGFDLVPVEKEIQKGDLVETSALGGIFPKGILVGEISELKTSDIQSFYEAKISPLFDLGELEMVFVILSF